MTGSINLVITESNNKDRVNVSGLVGQRQKMPGRKPVPVLRDSVLKMRQGSERGRCSALGVWVGV